MEIVLDGLDEVLCIAFHQRAVDQMLHNIIAFDSVESDSEVDLVISFYTSNIPKNVISFCETTSKPLILVRPWSSTAEKPLLNDAFPNVTISIRDLLIPGKASAWGPSDVNSWIDSLFSNGVPDDNIPSRFWVSLSDAIEAILTLIESKDIFGEEVLLSGRRYWSSRELINELELLWRRFVKIKSDEIRITDLEVQEPLLLESKFDGEKPNLSRLHSLLKGVNDYGWVAKTPMRVTLMKCLAALESDSR